MSKKRVYFGTKEKMSWVKAPSINMVRGVEKFGSSGTYTNGGGYVLGSAGSHENYDLSWSLTDSEDIDLVQMYYSGIYGSGLIYWSDPFVSHRNALPLGWSAPGLGAADAPTLFVGRKPTLVKTAANSIGLPVDTAVYVGSTGMQHREIWVPVPEGHSVAIGVIGSATGNGNVQYKKDNGAWTSLPFLTTSATTTVNTFLEGLGGGVSLRVQITTGTISLTALTVKVYKVEGISGGVATNLATNPSFEATSGTVEVWRNFVKNPNMVTTDNWVMSAGFVASNNTAPVSGLPSPVSSQIRAWSDTSVSGDRITTKLDGLTIGATYPVQVWAKNTGAIALIYITEDNNLTSPIVIGNGTTRPDWVLVTGEFTATKETHYLQIRQAGARTSPWVDLYLAGAVVGAPFYFDGSYSPDPDLTPSWTGAVNNSTSVLTGKTFSSNFYASATLRLIQSTRWSKTGQYSARVIRVAPEAGQALIQRTPLSGISTASARIWMYSETSFPGWPINFRNANAPYTAHRMDSGAAITPGEHLLEVRGVDVDAWAQGEIHSTFGSLPVGESLWFDAETIHEGEYTGGYFDGSTPSNENTIYYWNGTPNASTSTMRRLGRNSGANKFILGGGTSGMKFVPNTFNRVGYSAVVGKGLESAGVQLKEVGSWLN